MIVLATELPTEYEDVLTVTFTILLLVVNEEALTDVALIVTALTLAAALI